MRVVYTAVLAVWFAMVLGLSAMADTVLTVVMPDRVRTFTLEDLRALESVTFTTTTIWTEGEQTFTGVPLSTLLQELGLVDGMIEALAINDYSVNIPVKDALADQAVVAYQLNGKPMSVRDWGPLWMVYPYESHPEYQNEVIYSRSVWQLERILVEG